MRGHRDDNNYDNDRNGNYVIPFDVIASLVRFRSTLCPFKGGYQLLGSTPTFAPRDTANFYRSRSTTEASHDRVARDHHRATFVVQFRLSLRNDGRGSDIGHVKPTGYVHMYVYRIYVMWIHGRIFDNLLRSRFFGTYTSIRERCMRASKYVLDVVLLCHRYWDYVSRVTRIQPHRRVVRVASNA